MANAQTFDLDAYLSGFDPELLEDAEGRMLLTRLDPLLFALVYLPHHLRDEKTGNDITFADLHLDLVEHAKRWLVPSTKPREHRDAYVAPRETGKSTWLFTILPMWAAAHGHLKFIAAFAHSATQAQLHLQTFKHELETNLLLRNDFPGLCRPMRRSRGVTFADTQDLYYAKSGFVFAARGVDNATLGLKVESHRPDMLIMDDIEPDESSYSGYQMQKRLRTVQDAILPLNEYARTVIVGTVTMAGSIVHQLVRHARNEGTEDWIKEENFEVHYYPPIVVQDDGSERSIWPDKWSMDYLNSIRHMRTFKKNFANSPMGNDGGYWTDSDFTYGRLQAVTRTLLSIDPTVTTKKTSDPAGIAVIGFSPTERKAQVEFAEDVRLTGDLLRGHVLKLLVRFPHITDVLVETNQGGENWRDILHDLPGVRMHYVHQTAKKEVRAANTLSHYQRGRVLHTHQLVRAEEQMVSFPKAAHDDIVDAIGAGVQFFFPPKPPQRRSRSFNPV